MAKNTSKEKISEFGKNNAGIFDNMPPASVKNERRSEPEEESVSVPVKKQEAPAAKREEGSAVKKKEPAKIAAPQAKPAKPAKTAQEANADPKSFLINKHPKKELRNNKMGFLLSDTAKNNLLAIADSTGMSPNGVLNFMLENLYDILGESL